MFYNVGLILLSITAIIATIRYAKYESQFSSYFLMFIYVGVIVEAIGFYFYKLNYEYEDSEWTYFIYTFFEFNLVALMYLSIFEDDKTKKLIKFLGLIFNIIYFGSLLYDALGTSKIIIAIEYSLLSFFIIAYLRELLNSDRILNFKRFLPFWISAGLMTYFMSSIPFQFIRATIQQNELLFVQPLINYFMYGCFIYAFLWSKKETIPS